MGGPVSGILKGAVKEIDKYRDKYPMLYKTELTDAQRLLTETLSTMRHCAAAVVVPLLRGTARGAARR